MLRWWNGIHVRLRCVCRKAWEFESLPQHFFVVAKNIYQYILPPAQKKPFHDSFLGSIPWWFFRINIDTQHVFQLIAWDDYTQKMSSPPPRVSKYVTIADLTHHDPKQYTMEHKRPAGNLDDWFESEELDDGQNHLRHVQLPKYDADDDEMW